jgi:hypothetical protein
MDKSSYRASFGRWFQCVRMGFMATTRWLPWPELLFLLGVMILWWNIR